MAITDIGQTGLFDWVFAFAGGFITSGALVSTPVYGTGQPELVGYSVMLFGLLGLAAGPGPLNSISTLTEKVERLKQGEYDIDFPTDRTDDIGQLSRSLDGLADQLYRREQHSDRQPTHEQERETAPQERKRKLEALIENTTNPIYIKGRDGVYQFANEAMGEILELSPEDVVGKADSSLFDPGTLDDIHEGDRHVIEHEDSVTKETVAVVDGEKRVFLDNKYPYRDEDGNVIGIMGISRDITERQERERERKRYREFTDAVLDSIDDFFYVFDEEGTLLRWNSTLTEATGYSDEEIAEIDSQELFPEDKRDRVAESITTVFEEGSCHTEAAFLAKDGTRIPYESVATVLEDPDGNRVAAGIGRDITERKERERQITEQHERLRAIVENVPVVLFALDTDGRFTLSEGAGLDKLGLEPNEVVGESAFDIFADLPDVVEPVRRALNGKQVSVTTALGGLFWDTWYEPVLNDDGEVERVIGVSIDVTERRQREQDLRERERELSTLMDNIPGMVYRSENAPDWPFEFVSDGCREVTGYEPEALETDAVSWAEDIILEDQEQLWKTVQRAIENREPYRVIFPIETAEGKTRWVWEQGRGIFDEEGTLEALEGVIIDVSDQKETEHELERTKDLLEQTQRIANVGGWEYDMTTDPPHTGSFTDELYRIHELPTGSDIELVESLNYYPPKHRERLKKVANNAVETGESYDMEARFVTAKGNNRWVRTTGVPVYEDGELVKVRGALQDITRQKERELALESLQKTSQGLLGAETTEEIAQLVVDNARETLDIPGVAVYLLDEETNQLDPTAFTSAFVELCGDPDPIPINQGDSVLWSCFVSETQVNLDENPGEAMRTLGSRVEGGLVVPMDDYGVFVLAAPKPAIDGETSRLVETLVATTKAAFDRLENEIILRKRESELATRNRRLSRQVQINTIIRSIHRSLIGAESREEIERAVCERLAEADNVAFAWIGALNTSGDEMQLRAWNGPGQDYLDDQIDVADGTEPAVITAQSGKPTVVENVVGGLGDEDWRQRALLQNFHSVVSVPLSFDDFSFGVLTVYADKPETFSDLEQAVFAELGESIANSIMAVNTRKALYADTLVELTLQIMDDSFLTRVARDADCQIEYEGLTTHSADESRLFFTASSVDPQTVLTVLADLVSVTDFRLVSEDGDTSLFEVTLTGETLPSRLIRHGGSPRSIRVVQGGLEIVVDVPTTTDVREFLEMLETEYAGVELLARRDVGRSVQTRQKFLELLLDGLTDRQREVLKTAYYAGFFEWPRASTGEEIAEMLGVTQPTVNRHLRLSQQQLLDGLFEGGIAADD